MAWHRAWRAAVIGGCGLLALAFAFALPLGMARAEPPLLRPEVMDAHAFAVDYNETLVTLPVRVQIADGSYLNAEFQLTVFRPTGVGPFPLALVNHGRGPDRTYPSRVRGNRLVTYFVRRGFAVLVPTRAGYGGLGSRIDPEVGLRACDDMSIDRQISSVAAHTLAALDYAKAQPWADMSRVIVSGGSVGGYTSVVAAARGVPGALAVMNFAGGSGGNPKKSPGKPCNPERITKVFAKAGQTLRLPTLWVYAANDAYWGEALPKAWHAAFTQAGGRAEFVGLGTIEGEGHNAVGEGFAGWRKPADVFLTRLGFSAPVTLGAPKASGFAALEDAAKMPLQTAAAQAGYRNFLRADLPRVFVMSPGGAWAFRSGKPDSLSDALAHCTKGAKTACTPYAVDDAVVWPGNAAR